jgi:hypothetical protein
MVWLKCIKLEYGSHNWPIALILWSLSSLPSSISNDSLHIYILLLVPSTTKQINTTYNIQYIPSILLKMMINLHQKTNGTTLHNTIKSNTKLVIMLNSKSRSPICSCIAFTCSVTRTILLHTKVKQQTLYSSLNFQTPLKTNLSSTIKLSPKKLFYEWLYDKIVGNFWYHDNDNQHFHTVTLKTLNSYFFCHNSKFKPMLY